MTNNSSAKGELVKGQLLVKARLTVQRRRQVAFQLVGAGDGNKRRAEAALPHPKQIACRLIQPPDAPFGIHNQNRIVTGIGNLRCLLVGALGVGFGKALFTLKGDKPPRKAFLPTPRPLPKQKLNRPRKGEGDHEDGCCINHGGG